jgi:hypothetical protein
MSGRRVVIGKYNDGVTIGLRVSLPGVDALTGDSSDPGNFSFDSEWTDIAQIHQVSLTSRTTYTQPWGTGLVVTGFRTTWPALGYKPFVETRLYSAGVIYDDYFPNNPDGSPWISGSQSRIPDVDPNGLYCVGGASGDQMLSIVYAVAAPSG